MQNDTTNLEIVDKFGKTIVDHDRILNTSDPKWGHPEANATWFIDPTAFATGIINDPTTPQAERERLGKKNQAMLDAPGRSSPGAGGTP